jgi:hypothetical protein
MNRFNFDVADWDDTKEHMTELLRDRASQERTIAYSELVALVRPIQLQPDSHALAAMLGEISTEENEAGRGMLTVVVVHKEDDMKPGPGFFELAQKLGRQVGDMDVFWISEFKRVVDANRKSSTG